MANVVFAGNGQLAVQILDFLVETDDSVTSLLLHPEDDDQYVARNADDLMGLVEDALVVRGDEFRQPEVLEAIRDQEPDYLVSAGYGYLFRDADLLGLDVRASMNVHTSLLPLNRGRHTAPWTIINGDPAGVTIHAIDEDIDTGDTLAQTEVAYDLTDTPDQLYQRLYDEGAKLFRESWEGIKNDSLQPVAQDDVEATYNSGDELEAFEEAFAERTFDGAVEFVRALQGVGGETTIEADGETYRIDLTVEKN